MKLPGPWRITFDTNPDDCNMSCVMCENFSPYTKKTLAKPRRMEYEIIETAVNDAIPLGLKEIIPSTMGEPLLYAEFEKIIHLCQQKKIKLNLTTNGTWPRKSVEKWAELLCPVLSDVKISWNGVTAETQETIMSGSRYEKRVQDLYTFIKTKNEIKHTQCTVTLQCTFMKRNLSEIPGIVKQAIALGADRVKGHHLWVHYPELVREDLRSSKHLRQLWNETVKKCWEIKESSDSSIQLDNFTPLPEETETILPTKWVCPFIGKELWINAEGRIDPCCAPDAERKSLGLFGHINSNGDLEKAWNSAKYDNLINNQQNNLLCKKCNMRKPKEELI